MMMRKGRIIQTDGKYQITSFKTGKPLSKKYKSIEDAQKSWIKMRREHLQEEEE